MGLKPVRLPAIHQQVLPRDIARPRRKEKGDGLGNLGNRANPPQGRLGGGVAVKL